MKSMLMRWCTPFLLGAALVAWLLWENTSLKTTTTQICSPRLPMAFSGYRIAQVSDLHNAEFGRDNVRLRNALRRTNPDLIVLTGDLIDSYSPDMDVVLHFVRQAIELAPVCFIPGNHERRIKDYEQLKSALIEVGVAVLDNTGILIERNRASIALLGINDPLARSGIDDMTAIRMAASTIADHDGYTILLAHHPERFPHYAAAGVDLVFAGHAHGGQIRLPGIGGLIAPHQGFFPQYDAGHFVEGNTQMLVSCGLKSRIFPPRIGNRPELVVAELCHGEPKAAHRR